MAVDPARSTASDCLPVRDRIAPSMRVIDIPTGHRQPVTTTAGSR